MGSSLKSDLRYKKCGIHPVASLKNVTEGGEIFATVSTVDNHRQEPYITTV
jgi:hypothetical protein